MLLDTILLFMNSARYSISLLTVSQLLYFLAISGNLAIIVWCNYGHLHLAGGTGV